METLPTVAVEFHPDSRAIRMNWQNRVREQDVRIAFEKINLVLNGHGQPLYVVVDIRANPNFPLNATITGALFGPFRNPLLQAWLIIGMNPLARIIERTLKSVTGRSNVFWFSDDAEVQAYLEQQNSLSDGAPTREA